VAVLPSLVPMLATLAKELPRDQTGWTFEHKWDGIRALAYWDGTSLRFESRNLRDITRSWPDLLGLGEQLGDRPVVLDGEIVAFDDAHRPSFQLLQERMHVADAGIAARKAASVPASFLLFDVLRIGDEDLTGRPWTERRSRLEDLGIAGSHWAVTPTFPGEGDVLWAAAQATGLEGVMCKRMASPYRPGARSKDWLKVKVLNSEEFLVGGWSPGEGRRHGAIGSLLLGTPTDDGGLGYVGNVGTGFTDAELRRLEERLMPLRRDTSPFTSGPAPKRGAVFVDPSLQVEVVFGERTREGVLRHPSYKGVREG
jgi:bifunctional non-homologous end joining protein LigD